MYAAELGLSFDYQENNNGEPINIDEDINARFIKGLIEKGIEEIQDRVEETEERIASLER